MGNTDVKHSVAGFYYQLLLACKELVKLLNNTRSDEAFVAVEYGADVRVFNEDNFYFEAKFYNVNSFSRHHNAVTHSIYNFFNTFKAGKDGRYIFKPNIPVSKDDISFYANWPGSNPPSKEYINYIKECFVCESITKDSIKNTEFKKFRDEYSLANPHKKKPQYRRELLKHLNQNSDHQSYMLPEIQFTDDDIKLFITKLDFEFPKNRSEKYESIKVIKEVIDNCLKQFNSDLNNEQIKKIRLLIMESFLDSTVHNEPSDETLIKGNFRVVRVADCKQLINEVNIREVQYMNKEELQDIIDDVEKELDNYEYILNKQGYKDQIGDIMAVLLNMKEQLYQEIKKYGARNVSRRYILAKKDYPIEILRLFENISEMMNKTNTTNEDIRIDNQTGINNVSIGEKFKFSMQALPAASSGRHDARLLINSFISHTQDFYLIPKAEGNETILFDSEYEFCKYSKKEIDDTVIDIFHIHKNKDYQEYYKSFDYKCTKCLRLAYEGSCELLNDLRGEVTETNETTDGLIRN